MQRSVGKMKTPRPYQEKAIQAVFDYFNESTGNPLIVAPVAAGKSLLMAETAKRACTTYPATRILVLAHNKELIEQNCAELLDQWPDAETGYYCAGLGKKKTSGQIIYATVQSIYKQALKHKPFDLVFVDECHLISPDQDSMYQQLFTSLLQMNPYVKIVGFTGTPYRTDTGLIVNGDVFDRVASEIGIQYLIDNEFLCPPITPDVKTKMDTTGVKIRGGDFIESQLQKAVNNDKTTKLCVDELIDLGKDRKSWLVFTAGIEHCEAVRDEIRSRGITCEMVTGQTDNKMRHGIIENFKEGKIQCLVNVAVLTTGFNNPRIDLLAFMRPTRSPVLYVQCIGRGMRTHPDKENVMVLDFGGVIDELGPIDKVNQIMETRGKGDGEAPMKQCSSCYAFVHAAVKECEECGFAFPISELGGGLSKSAARNQAILAEQITPTEKSVLFCNYSVHKKAGKPDSMKVTYTTTEGAHSEWVCFEHTGYARDKAVAWHKKRSSEPAPATVTEALAIDYPRADKLTVKRQKKNPKYWEIVSATFKPKEVEIDDIESDIF